jgi:hypothetical protein
MSELRTLRSSVLIKGTRNFDLLVNVKMQNLETGRPSVQVNKLLMLNWEDFKRSIR